jgi:hypothetical protein
VEAQRFPYSVDNWLTDGGEVVSLMRRPPFKSQEDSWYSDFIVAAVNRDKMYYYYYYYSTHMG